MNRLKPLFSRILCVAFALAAALTMTACGGHAQTPPASVPVQSSADGAAVLGEGQSAFTLQVVDGDGRQTDFSIRTDEQTVGAALQQLGLIEGEMQAYGLYVKTVNGIPADYAVDQTYWAFYINGEYAMAGVDSTPVENGAVYALKVSK